MENSWVKQEFKRIFKQICRWKGIGIKAWHVGDDHIHLLLLIPPKYSVSYAVSVIKAKSSAWIKKKTKKFPVGSLWARGYFVSTIGLSQEAVKKYVQNQQHHQIEPPTQLGMF
jgi:putative transposase